MKKKLKVFTGTILFLVAPHSFAGSHTLGDLHTKLEREIKIGQKLHLESAPQAHLRQDLIRDLTAQTDGKVSSRDLNVALNRSFHIKDGAKFIQIEIASLGRAIQDAKKVSQEINRLELDASGIKHLGQIDRAFEVMPKFLSLAASITKPKDARTQVEVDAFAKELSIVNEMLSTMQTADLKTHLDIMQMALDFKAKNPNLELDGNQALAGAIREKYQDKALAKIQELSTCSNHGGASCDQVFQAPQIGKLIKTRHTGTRIFRLTDANGVVTYFKENDPHPSSKEQVFTNNRMGVLARNLFESFGLNGYIAKTVDHPEGMEVSIDGQIIKLSPGILQEGRAKIVTVLDQYKEQNGRNATDTSQLQPLLNTPEWAKHYANWKLAWTLLRQVDLNVANLGISDGKLFLFDLGDALNKVSDRCQFGICSHEHQFDINFPDNANDRREHRPDFRNASDDLKAMIRSLANSSAADVAERLGIKASEILHSPREDILTTARSIRDAARWLSERLDQSPL